MIFFCLNCVAVSWMNDHTHDTELAKMTKVDILVSKPGHHPSSLNRQQGKQKSIRATE